MVLADRQHVPDSMASWIPQDIASEVVSDDNPKGRLTNSNLELAVEVLAIRVALTVAPKVKHVPRSNMYHWGHCVTTPLRSAGLKEWCPRPRGPQLGAFSEAWR